MSKDDFARTSHPSIGAIHISRVSGHRHLVGSAVAHQHYVALRISRADLMDWDHRDAEVISKQLPIVEIAMTEAQFSRLICSWGQGSGVPCTLTDAPPEGTPTLRVEQPPTAKPLSGRLSDKYKEILDETRDRLESAKREVRQAVGDRLGVKATKEIDRTLDLLVSLTHANLAYVEQMMAEMTEAHVDRARYDVEAAMQNALLRAGQIATTNALPSSTEAVVEIPEKATP